MIKSRVMSSASHASHSELSGAYAEQLRELQRAGRDDEAVARAIELVELLQREKALLELKIRELLREKSGRRTEKMDPEQLALMLDATRPPGEPEPGPEVEPDPDPVAETPHSPRPKRRPKRTSLPKDLPREVITHELDPADRTCSGCGDVMPRIGEDTSEVLEIIPAQFRVEEHRRAKYACPHCKDCVVTAPGPTKIIDGGMPGAGLLAHVAVSKYQDHLPLNRLSQLYGRHGVVIPTSTLCDWVATVAHEVRPIVDRIEQQVRASHVIQTDASGLRVLDRDDPEGIRRGTMWCYVGDRRHVAFRYTPTGEGADGPWEFLSGRAGLIQADASNIFDRLFNGKAAKAVEAGCWAHARRRFVQLAETDRRAAWPLQLIQKLYRVERHATDAGLDDAARLEERKRWAPPILEKLQRWLIKTAKEEPPKSALHQACAYSLNHWTALTRFLDDGALALDNNLCELQIRSLAVGRKNYLFAGSDKGAERAATLYSLLRTCALNDVPPLEYLTDVLTKLAQDWPQARIDELLPDQWQRTDRQ